MSCFENESNVEPNVWQVASAIDSVSSFCVLMYGRIHSLSIWYHMLPHSYESTSAIAEALFGDLLFWNKLSQITKLGLKRFVHETVIQWLAFHGYISTSPTHLRSSDQDGLFPPRALTIGSTSLFIILVVLFFPRYTFIDWRNSAYSGRVQCVYVSGSPEIHCSWRSCQLSD